MNTRLRPLRLLAILALLAAPLFSQEEDDAPSILGQIDENNIYTGVGGHFSIAVPVMGELGGTVHDTASMVTFRDPYGVHVAIASLPFDAASRAELEKRGRKDFLAWLFSQHVQPEYQKSFPGTTAESAKYIPTVQDGSLLVMNLLPGGTAFRDRIFLVPGETPPVAKRGSLVFIKNDRIFIITTELYERILKSDTFKKTPEEEDAILRKRLLDLLAKMTFPTVASSTPEAQPAAATK